MENKHTWVNAYNNIYFLNAGGFVAKLDLLQHNESVEYNGDKDFHDGDRSLQKQISILFKRYVLSVRNQDGIEYTPICYFLIDTRKEDELKNKIEAEEQNKAYKLRLFSAIDRKLWDLEGDAPSQEILDRSIEILRAMAFIE